MQYEALLGNSDFVGLACYFVILFTSLLFIFWALCLILGSLGTLKTEKRQALPAVSLQPTLDNCAWKR